MFTVQHSALRLYLLAASLLCALASPPAGAAARCDPDDDTLTPGDHNLSMEFEGRTCDFLVHVPPSYDGRTPVPLVIDLHGSFAWGAIQLVFSGFSRVADAHGFLLVAPTGYRNSWNGDIEFGAAKAEGLDDVGLMRALVEHVRGLGNVHRGKVYVTGLSNGAAMTNTLACEAADVFAAVAPVADPLDIGLPTCMPSRPISVLGFHGYDDDSVPYEGGAGNGPDLPTPFPSIPDTLVNWGEVMGCAGAPELIPIQGESKCEIYRECDGDAQVGYCSLEAGHIPYQQDHLDIAEYAWTFFEQFSLPLADADGDGLPDEDDNCPFAFNPEQTDVDGDCIGDACQCSQDEDCDDTTFCNGLERCSAGTCEPGALPCTEDQTCEETTQACTDPASADGPTSDAPVDAGIEPGVEETEPGSGVDGTEPDSPPGRGTDSPPMDPPVVSNTDDTNVEQGVPGATHEPSAAPAAKASGRSGGCWASATPYRSETGAPGVAWLVGLASLLWVWRQGRSRH